MKIILRTCTFFSAVAIVLGMSALSTVGITIVASTTANASDLSAWRERRETYYEARRNYIRRKYGWPKRPGPPRRARRWKFPPEGQRPLNTRRRTHRAAPRFNRSGLRHIRRFNVGRRNFGHIRDFRMNRFRGAPRFRMRGFGRRR
jgi:hypothetical protein